MIFDDSVHRMYGIGVAMKHVSTSDLKGNEILALPVVSESNVILIQSDTVLNEELIARLQSLNEKMVFIKEDKVDEVRENREDQRKRPFKLEETAEKTYNLVEHVLERHIYKHNEDLKVIGEAANTIIKSVVEEPEIISSVTEIRNLSTDMYTHCINVCALSTIMSLRLKMSDKQVRNVAIGAILHDIGLKYIQAPYTDVSIEEMNEKDMTEYKKHTIFGYSSIQDEKWLPDISKEIILLHHEQIDGNGFPFRHKADKLKAEIKLVSICDEFDSLISGIGNRKLKMYQAIEYIKVNSGKIYDKAIAAKFLESVAVYPVGLEVITNNGEIGKVIRQNKDVTDRPVIEMLKHSDGSDYAQYTELDLLKNLTAFIVDTL